MKRVLTLNDKINLRGAYEKKGILGMVKIELVTALGLTYSLYGVPLLHFLDGFPKKWRR